jgi:hypothetical protein
MLHLWLRKELDNERRTPLSPVNAERLISAGFKGSEMFAGES